MHVSPETNRVDGGRSRRRSVRVPVGAALGRDWRVCRLSLPGRRWGAECGERVVTGGKSGLRASGGKGIDKKIARAALVTAW